MKNFTPKFSFTCKLNEINIVIEALFDILKDSGVVILKGELAAGKTTFVQHVAAYLNLDDVVTSPTFSIQQCYGNKIFHYDIYNQGLDHFIALGLLEELERDGYHFVEWGNEKLYAILKAAHINVVIIEIEKENSKRKYRITNA